MYTTINAYSKCYCRLCSQCRRIHSGLPCGCICKLSCRCRKLIGLNTYSISSSRGSFKELTLTRNMGLELEIGHLESDRSRFDEYYGQWHRDSSVEPSGMEFVTNPLVGDKLLQFTSEFLEYLKVYKGRVNNTCGLHVHVDARDFDYYDIAKLIVVWSKIENDVYRLCNTKRSGSDYCWMLFRPLEGIEGRKPWISNYIVHSLNKPWIKLQDLKALVLEAVYRHKITWPTSKTDTAMQGLEYIKNLYRSKYLNHGYRPADNYGRLWNPRYAGLNLHSWFYRNTIEFRMKEGTLDFDEIISWAVLCGSIIELVKGLSYQQVQDIRCLRDLLEQETKTYRVQSKLLNYFKEKLT